MKLSNLVPSRGQALALALPCIAAFLVAVAIGCSGKPDAPVAAPPADVDPGAAAAEEAPQE